MAQAPLSLCFSPVLSDSQESPYFLRPQFATATPIATHVPLAKASRMGEPKISEAGKHILPVPVLCKATWQRQKGVKGWEQKPNLPL